MKALKWILFAVIAFLPGIIGVSLAIAMFSNPANDIGRYDGLIAGISIAVAQKIYEHYFVKFGLDARLSKGLGL